MEPSFAPEDERSLFDVARIRRSDRYGRERLQLPVHARTGSTCIADTVAVTGTVGRALGEPVSRNLVGPNRRADTDRDDRTDRVSEPHFESLSDAVTNTPDHHPDHLGDRNTHADARSVASDHLEGVLRKRCRERGQRWIDVHHHEPERRPAH